ncbi:MAG TPA: head GIN domain-containing protein [Chitinophagaceae bacterium]|nr:head GIN domain-containing protein [Chitinophagaceae bacterium]
MKGIMISAAMMAFVFLFSCSKYEAIRGDGRTLTETRIVPQFSSVETHYDIRANIIQGTTQEIKVTGYENLLAILETEVENGVLRLKYNNRYNTIRNGNVVVNITVPAISKATIHGSNNIEVSGFQALQGFEGLIHGSGNIKVSNSTSELAKLLIYGSGRIDAQELQTKRTEASIFGSGNISVTVSEQLEAKIYGSGNVNYWGNPSVQTEMQGSGRVIKK